MIDILFNIGAEMSNKVIDFLLSILDASESIMTNFQWFAIIFTLVILGLMFFTRKGLAATKLK